MLTEERHSFIISQLQSNGTITVSELVELLDISESTIRRDLNSLNQMGKLKKVHGGATLPNKNLNTIEENVVIRQNMNTEDKIRIAKYAASLISKNDFVYIDAGTTTELMIDYITEKNAIFITNGIVHARKLIQKNCKVYILGGELKMITEAIIGVEAINSLKRYNFTKGFFGTNGISIESGYTTPDIMEALVKEEALSRTNKAFVLCDITKLNQVSSITFGSIKKATIITTELENNNYNKYTEVVEVDR